MKHRQIFNRPRPLCLHSRRGECLMPPQYRRPSLRSPRRAFVCLFVDFVTAAAPSKHTPAVQRPSYTTRCPFFVRLLWEGPTRMAAMASNSDSGAGGRSATASPSPTDADRIAELQESVKRIEASKTLKLSSSSPNCRIGRERRQTYGVHPAKAVRSVHGMHDTCGTDQKQSRPFASLQSRRARAGG